MAFLIALFCIASGLYLMYFGYQLQFDPIEVLWQRVETNYRRRGLNAERTLEWESRARNGSLILGFMGLLMVLAGFCSLVAAIPPTPMSGVSMNGHELTKAEWDGCNHNITACLNMHPKYIQR